MIRSDKNGISSEGCRIEDVSDVAGVGYVLACDVCTNTNDVLSSGDVAAGCHAQGCIEVAGGVGAERRITDSGVESAIGVCKKRSSTASRVHMAGVIVKERLKATGHVADAIDVRRQRTPTKSTIVYAVGVR